MEHALLAAIRARGLKQWQVAVAARLRESRLSRIIRHGGATDDERQQLAAALGVPEPLVFGDAPNLSALLDAVSASGPQHAA